MKKLIFIFCLMFFCVFYCYAENNYRQWTRIWGSVENERGFGGSVDNAGNVYVCGWTPASFDGQNNPCGGTGTNASCLKKYDTYGSSLWTRIWGSISYDDYCGAVSVDNSGNAYAGGWTLGSFDGQSNPSPGIQSSYLTKFDSSGSSLWTRIWGCSNVDCCQDVSVDSNCNVYVCDYANRSFDGQSNPGNYSPYLTNFDSNGNKQWTRIWGSINQDRALNISVNNAGNIYVCGWTEGDFDGQTNPGNSSLYLTKFDSSGSSLWTRIWGSTDSDHSHGVKVDSAGNVYISGFTKGSFNGQNNPSNGVESLCLTKYNSSGSSLWTRIWGSTSTEYGWNVNVDDADNVYVGGYTYGSFDGQNNPCGGKGTNALCLTKYNSSGSSLWTRIWGSTSYDYCGWVTIDNANNIYVSGNTYGSYDRQSNPGGRSLCLTKFWLCVKMSG